MVELLSPCSDWATLKAAVISGADAVYFGVKSFNMRAKAKNFKVSELPRVVKYCHDNKVKAYLTVNSIIYEPELRKVENLIKKTKKAAVDAVIIQDLSLIPVLKKYKLAFHISTQASVSNSRAANQYKKLGATRVILARECSLKDLKKIVKNSKIEIEVFIHGAMCVSVSGRCFFSGALFGKSADRGECVHPCRREWTVIGEGGEVVYDGARFLNAKDLCTISFLDKIIKSGVSGLKIEGRMKDANYVSTVTRVYREAIDNWNKKRVSGWLKRLRSVFNRGFSSGFYLGVPTRKDIDFTGDGSRATVKKLAVGVVRNYYQKQSAAKVYLNHTGLKIGDDVIVEGSTTFLKQKVESLQVNRRPVKSGKKKEYIALKVVSKVREGDKVYKLIKV
jgi:putative protease